MDRGPVIAEVRTPAMSNDVPKERDFDPCGVDLDAQCAWRNFGGLSLEEACRKFEEAPENYQEDFMFMGGKAFAFYYPVIDRFLRKTIDFPVNERGDRQSSILPHCIRGQFNGADRRYVSALKQPVLDLCDFMLQHIQFFADDWDDSTEIENNWRHLQEHVRQYKALSENSSSLVEMIREIVFRWIMCSQGGRDDGAKSIDG